MDKLILTVFVGFFYGYQLVQTYICYRMAKCESRKPKGMLVNAVAALLFGLALTGLTKNLVFAGFALIVLIMSSVSAAAWRDQTDWPET